ncbi:hypothetical protein NE237_000229 [Protea cynaroides]|uniref:SURP motif domain-containing protein n=1 Tax=Protea cynaroides TaxID=273540 RepID=A0A9Q0KQQ2_9MAGN|nr:hypothetical protein NE237_000229 [Protea cynaroides]
MNLEVYGSHALLFDDDPTAAFVNSRDSLVEWNSLLIDRYDVRHLLQHPPPPLKRRRHQPSETELDQERYLDLPPPFDDHNSSCLLESDNGAEPAVGGGYHTVAFSYGNSFTDKKKNSDAGLGDSSVLTPFPVPEGLLQNLILGAGKEFFRSKKENSLNNPKSDVAGGALSLLGSVYGSGEDEDGARESLDAENTTIAHGSECAESSVGLSEKVGEASKPPLHAAKEKSLLSKRNRSVTADNSDVTHSKKREGNARGSSGVSVEKPHASTLPSTPKVEPLILEPPSHLKRMVDKIVEFILKNGKEFEAILIEQDSKNGRYPFLLPSDQYHPYYLNVLQKAQESKFPGKCLSAQDHDAMGNVAGKKVGLSKDDNGLSKGYSASDIPFDSERKEKFKMVGGSKRDAQGPPPKPIQQQCGVSVDTVAAILQAATRGLRNPEDILPNFGNPSSSRGRSSTQKPIPNGEPSVSMPIELSRSAGHSERWAIAKTAALAAACEADSSEASLTKEEKQKAERLKRAKMFAAMVKGGTAPPANDLLPRLSAEPQIQCTLELNDVTLAPNVSNLSSGEVDLLGRKREGSSVPVDANTSDRSKSETHDSDDDYNERKSRKKHRSRSIRRDHKHHHKKLRSHHSSSHRKDEHKHRKRHSSLDYKESRRRHRYHSHSSSEDEHKHRCRSEKHRNHSKRKVEHENDIREVLAQTKTLRVDDRGNRESNALAAGTPPPDTTEVSDELRAKVRVMLLQPCDHRLEFL